MMIKIGDQTRGKSQGLSQVFEKFCINIFIITGAAVVLSAEHLVPDEKARVQYSPVETPL